MSGGFCWMAESPPQRRPGNVHSADGNGNGNGNVHIKNDDNRMNKNGRMWDNSCLLVIAARTCICICNCICICICNCICN